MSSIEHLLRVSRAYAKAESIKLSAVSWRVFGDSKKLGAIADGADIQVRRFEQAMAWFSANWPKSTRWPSDIPRPAVPANDTDTQSRAA